MRVDSFGQGFGPAAGGPGGQAGGPGGQALCPDCGAVLAADEPRCPYCGALNPAGAERAYLGELDGIRAQTGGLADEAKGTFRSSVRSNARRTIAIVALVVAAIAGILLVAGHLDDAGKQRELREFQDREAFRAAYFGEFDALYEASDYEALSEYVWKLVDEPGFDAAFSWKHMPFLELHDDWAILQVAREEAEAGQFTLDDYTWMVGTALRMVQLDGADWYALGALDSGEEELVSEYRAYAWQVLEDTLQMDEAGVAAFAGEFRDDYGYIQQDGLKKGIDARLRQLGTL